MPPLNQLLIYSTKSCCFPQHGGMPLPLPISLAYQTEKAQAAATSSRWCTNSSFKPAGGSQPRYSLSGLLGCTSNPDWVKEGNDKAPGRLAVELSHRGARLVTESGGERVVPREVVKPHHGLQRGSVQQVRHFLPLCVFILSWGRQHSRAAQ